MGKSDGELMPDAAPAAAATPAGRARRILRAGAFCALTVALSAAVSAVTVRLMVPETVTFDMKGTVDTFMQQSAKQPLTEEKAQALTIRFDAALKDSLRDWQVKHGGTVLVAPAVVSPARDITPDIRADIARRMQARP